MKRTRITAIAAGAPLAIALGIGGAATTDATAWAAKAKTLKLVESSSGLTPKSLHATAGTVTIDFTNTSGKSQALTVEKGTKKVGSTPAFASGSKTLTLKSLSPGKYTLVAGTPGSGAGALKGTLTVKKYVEPVIY